MRGCVARGGLWLSLLISSIIATGCSFLLPSQYSGYPLERELQRTDFPASWYRQGGTFEDVADAEYSHIVAYGPSEEAEYLMISQQLTVYPSARESRESYSDWTSTWFPTENWRKPQGWGYVPRDSADQYHVACQSFSVNDNLVLSCRYLQQHDEFISLLLTNIDGEQVTKEIFLAVLEAQDIRLNR